ncbi:uncharacterized protein LOC110179475 [Drosophila serrata]|uniref:uncharacterized protein LOC110179475 n=1 Tax=Drosophila serrata TaxID=7274 RepID=UPI000A1D1256|nr:uncharacterized protein LOC110179475 [Drosophila serrata]
MTETASSSSSTPRLGMCEVCAAKEARYACPKCEVKTCCLDCVQIHKKELSCDGQRDRTKFVPLNQMTSTDFMSDYCFLEEATRYTEARKSDRTKSFTHDSSSNNKNLSVAQHRLRTAAYWRNVRLELLLPNFSKHKENTTYFDWKQRCIFWRVEWQFVNIPAEENDQGQAEAVARFVDARCDEHETLANFALKYVDLQQETARNHRKRLAHHQTAGIGQLSFWLQAERVPFSATRCYALEASKPLGKNLSRKTIIEFPTIYVTYEPKPPLGFEAIECDNWDLGEEAPTSSPPAKKFKKERRLYEEKMASKERGKRFTQDNRSPSMPSQKRLRKAALSRKVRLQWQEPNFSKHKENTTYWDCKLSCLFWRVEWYFVNIPTEEGDNFQFEAMARFVDARCDENDKLADLVLKYVDLEHQTAQNNLKRLSRHQTVGIGQLSFWLRADGVNNSDFVCYALNATEPLGKNIAGKTIIEFPTIFITHEPKPPMGFNVIECDNLELKEETSASEEETKTDVFHGMTTTVAKEVDEADKDDGQDDFETEDEDKDDFETEDEDKDDVETEDEDKDDMEPENEDEDEDKSEDKDKDDGDLAPEENNTE